MIDISEGAQNEVKEAVGHLVRQVREMKAKVDKIEKNHAEERQLFEKENEILMSQVASLKSTLKTTEGKKNKYKDAYDTLRNHTENSRA